MKNKEGLVIMAAEQILNGATKISAISYCQQCLLCENTRNLPEGMRYCDTPWICDECKEAIVFVKDFMRSCNKAQTMFDEMKDPTKNIYPL